MLQVVFTSDVVVAYIGPGAGIALAGSFLAVLVAMATAMMALITWPLRWVVRQWRGRTARQRRRVRRVVILGLDGLDPLLVDEYLQQGLLPNLAALRERGTYTRLGTTWPPLSPVAWSSFSTGTNPGKHNIFDFLTRDAASYGPRISSVRIRPPRRHLRWGDYRVPLSRPRLEALRKSKPFWTVLGESGVFSAVLRVPITFPPDRFQGVQLSAMCVPDIRGTQGTFAYFRENGRARQNGDTSAAASDLAGEQITVERDGDVVTASLPGPPNPLRFDARQASVPLRVNRQRSGQIVLHIAGQQLQLQEGRFTDWQRVPFRLAPGVRAWGICRFFLRSFTPFELYATAVQIDPGKPLMPISHPKVYSIYLAKQQGRFATLGLAEDTWSLSEGLMSEEAFLKAAYDIDEERQNMFFDALRRVPRGLVACVFDAPDRVQHMFWRFGDPSHPARGSDAGRIEANRNVIRDMYVRMDKLVGKTLASIDDQTALIVMSDHGFKPFRRGVDLNAWLREQGYLKLKDGASTSNRSYMADVDWSQTRAYAVGLAGIFLNLRGRESQGIVAPGAEAQQLVRELCAGLTGLADRDNGTGAVAIHEAVPRESVYHGPYVETAPDIIVGYNVGYRVSWDAAVGKCGPAVLSDNTKAWSGDHCIHPSLVPGVLFSNYKLNTASAEIIDLGPTVLDLLGVAAPDYMDGKSLLCSGANSST
jgi:predicted AlkP superfamily phosphohydrolase/phosphomutase